MDLQRTIGSRVNVKGIGLHTGKEVQLWLSPAAPNSGINFKRLDLENLPTIPAVFPRVADPLLMPRRTTVGEGAAIVQTVEHLMSALCGLSIDNVTIELDGDEVPGLDGSALPYVKLINKAGIVQQDAPRRYIVIKEPLWLENGDTSMAIFPCDDYRVSYTLSYDSAIGSQYASFPVNDKVFENEIAPSRTFCLLSEVDELRKMGLGRGANYENTIVVSADGSVKNKLRFPDEFVRHKISDLIGDLYLLGAPIKGHVVAVRSGHVVNIGMLKKLSLYAERQLQAAISAPSREPLKRVPFNSDDVKKILPHREPFLFVDEIIELEEDRRVVGLRHVSQEEDYFRGHFPGKPVMPGVLILEALAQVAGVLVLSKEENRGKLAYFASMDRVKFRKPVLPGDTLRLAVEMLRMKAKMCMVKGQAFVGDNLAAEAELMFMLVER